jgi:hypothetical protein
LSERALSGSLMITYIVSGYHFARDSFEVESWNGELPIKGSWSSFELRLGNHNDVPHILIQNPAASPKIKTYWLVRSMKFFAQCAEMLMDVP